MTKTSSISQLLGFYFLIFISNPDSSYIRCWFDGSDDSTLFQKSTLLDLCKKYGVDFNTQSQLAESFNQTSYFLWDVEANTIKPLYSTNTRESITRDLLKNLPTNKQQRKEDFFTVGWKHEISEKGLKIL